ncbi:MAG TPA: hypothetical protein VIF60_17815 [Burkholderiaceae bacterium]|jgi:hypothetical protein
MFATTVTRRTTLLPVRMALVRFNRFLAWTLIASPVIEFVLHARFEQSLFADLILIFAHGALSLFLFGVPKLKGHGFIFSMHVMGLRPSALSARNRFLLGGYRIALAMTPAANIIPGIGWIAFILALYPVLRLPVSVLQHIYGSAEYALQRWGMKPWPAELIVVLYVFLSIANFSFAVFGGAR